MTFLNVINIRRTREQGAGGYEGGGLLWKEKKHIGLICFVTLNKKWGDGGRR